MVISEQVRPWRAPISQVNGGLIGLLALALLAAPACRKEKATSQQEESPAGQTSTRAPDDWQDLSIVPPPPKEVTDPRRLPPVALRGATVDAFVDWATTAPGVQASEIIAAIAAATCLDGPPPDAPAPAACDGAVLDGLFARVEKGGSSALVALSIVGELADPRAVDRLRDLIWRAPPADAVPPRPEGLGGAASLLMLEAHAVRALAWIRTEEALDEVLRVATGHDDRMVRAAAVDAYRYQMGDSPEARAQLSKILRPEDARLVDAVRKAADDAPGSFDARLRAYLERYPNTVKGGGK